MGTTAEIDLLERIYVEMQDLKKQISAKNESRISIKEFSKRMNMSEVTLYDRIKKGEIDPPLKDGRYSYYLSSYVNKIVTSQSNSDKISHLN